MPQPNDEEQNILAVLEELFGSRRLTKRKLALFFLAVFGLRMAYWFLRSLGWY